MEILKLNKEREEIVMKKLTEEQVKMLQDCKGVRGGAEKFYDILEDIYKDDEETLKKIKKCHEIYDSLDWVIPYAAHEKSKNMYYHYMDELLNEVGYHAKKGWES